MQTFDIYANEAEDSFFVLLSFFTQLSPGVEEEVPFYATNIYGLLINGDDDPCCIIKTKGELDNYWHEFAHIPPHKILTEGVLSTINERKKK